MPLPELGEERPPRPPLARNDEVLRSYVEAGDDRTKSQALEHLLTAVAAPLVESVLRRKSGRFGARRRFEREDEQDITATVMFRLVRRLTRDLGAAPIENFTSYVTATTAHVCDDHLRLLYPARARLAHAIRRELRRDARFAMWRSGSEVVCGLREWRDCGAVPVEIDALVLSLPIERAVSDSLADLFRAAAGPISLSAAMSILARQVGADSQAMVTEGPEDADSVQDEPLWRSLHLRRTADAVWREIQSLPENQRIAVLLSIRDASLGTALRFFPLTGVATLTDVAGAVGMGANELADLWPELPMPDSDIALRLGLTRQQVINLRASARRRLTRRLATNGFL